ncbi:hypothetical protein IAI51_25950 [Pseudomonas sp. N40(2020)]|uniref:hypothetical protein n=1 Tax=Pseudomonas sp. N40(2020) TaxID=2767798 RepID=UPI001656B807|nr:hypothetical protein [Pseudomonas sp. N40(2020)]MBC8999975.1 hypothetical protein [Pseudomonas sp. N40(2020)]
MTAIGTLGLGNSGVEALSEAFKNTADKHHDAESTTGTTPTLVEGVKVSLSGASIEKSASAGGDNRDIEESGLPENIQQLLKMIRNLQQQIAEKNARIKAVMADKTLSTEVKIAKLAALKGAIAALNNGLITANLSLSKVMNQSDLTPEQTMKTASLLMKN